MQIVDIAGLTPAQLESVTAIYQDAFGVPWEMPAAELPQFARARAGDSHAGRALALLDAGAALGLALSSYLPLSNLLHFKYLVIDAARRNRGLGPLLLEATIAAGETIAQAVGQGGCRGALIEVEIPDSPPPDADRHLRQRRIGFYLRHGAIATGVPFARPPSAPAEEPEWEVMLLPGRGWSGVLDSAARRELGWALMVEGYGSDPQAAWLAEYLDSLPVCGARGAML